MKGFGIIKPMVSVGWLEKEKPVLTEYGAILVPVAISPCTSDVHAAFELGDTPTAYNRILGHEAIGRIVEVGPRVKDFKVGDVVTFPSVTPNWRAPNIQDEPHQHSDHIMGGLKISTVSDGVMAEYFPVDDADLNLARIPENVSIEDALMVGDMMTTGFHGAELAEVKFGDTVCVMGIGPVGLMAVAGAALRGASKIFGVGSRPNCVKLAKEYGATDFINYKEGPVHEQVLAKTNGRGVDCVIVAGGNQDSIESAGYMTRPGGVIANVNVFVEPTLTMSTWSMGMLLGHKKLVGGMCPGGRRRLERLLDMIAAGRVQPGKMLTHIYHGIDSLPEAFDIMKNKPADLIKPVVYF